MDLVLKQSESAFFHTRNTQWRSTITLVNSHWLHVGQR